MTQPDKEKEQQEIKASTSMATQVLDLKEQIKTLKMDLRNREARLLAIEDVLNQVLSSAHIDSSVLYKEINKHLTTLADLIDSTVTTQINSQIRNIAMIDVNQQSMLSAKFRNKEGLPPLVVEEADLSK